MLPVTQEFGGCYYDFGKFVGPALTYSQDPAIGPYPEPAEPRPRPIHLRYISTCLRLLRIPNGLFP